MSEAVALLDHSHLLEAAEALRESGEMSRLMSAGLQGVDPEEWDGYSKDRWSRERSSNRWATWRAAVFERDGFHCVHCGADSTRSAPLDPHHILPKATHPEAMYDVSNGVTLCRPCHTLTFGCEAEWEDRFRAYVEGLEPSGSGGQKNAAA